MLSAKTIERILTEINNSVQLCMGGKLTKFRGHKGITENHKSFISENLLPYGIYHPGGFIDLPMQWKINMHISLLIVSYPHTLATAYITETMCTKIT